MLKVKNGGRTMIITDNIYQNTDEECQEICEFLDRLSIQNPNMLWESGRMNYWRYTIHAKQDPHGSFFQDNVHIWRSQQRGIVGLCISEYGENDLFIEVLPEYHEIYPDIFRWIEDMWAHSREAIDIDVFGADKEKIDQLKAHGFSFQRHSENKRTYDLDEINPGYRLEEGFRVRTFSEFPDYAGRVALVQSAFDNPHYSEENLKGLLTSPDYIEEYHLMVVSPDDQPVAYCAGWHDSADDRRGYIEPVGTHAGYRRRGFATALIRECFARMKANGIKSVGIASSAEPDVANYLYDSLSPKTKREVHRYSKEV